MESKSTVSETSLKTKMERVWEKHEIADPLRFCVWIDYGPYLKTKHSHYRVAPIKVKRK